MQINTVSTLLKWARYQTGGTKMENGREVNTARWTTTLIIAAVTIGMFLIACGGISDIIEIVPAGGEEAMVDQVEAIATKSDPPTYSVVASGRLPDGCTEVGRSRQEVDGQTIRVTLYAVGSGDGKCSGLEPVPFKEIISLDVRGLPAGSYTVEVNGAVTSLTLTADH